MSSNRPRVMVGISEHWLLGSLPLADDRIQDRLNDSRSDFIELSDVEVHSCDKRECVANLSEPAVPKSKIAFIAAHQRQHEAPQRRLNHFAHKDVFKVFVTVSRYQISGKLHLPTFAGNAVHTLTHQLLRFFPLTDAALSGCGEEQFCVPLLIVNKDFVNCFHVDNDMQSESAEEPLKQLRDLVGEPAAEPAPDGGTHINVR